MKNWRKYSIRNLIQLVFFCGIGFAALRMATPFWDAFMVVVLVLSFSLATALAMIRTGRQRAFWIGFALFGGFYLAATMIEDIEMRLPTTHWFAEWANRRFVVAQNQMAQASGWGDSPQRQSMAPMLDMMGRTTIGKASVLYSDPDNHRVWSVNTGLFKPSTSTMMTRSYDIAQDLTTLGLALIGGWLIRLLHDQEAQKRQRDSEKALEPENNSG